MANITYLEQYIKDGKQATISLKNLYESLLVTNSNNKNHIFRTSFDDFFIQHRDHIKDCINLFQISDIMYYKPKMVSHELYGTTELWISLLRINNMTRISEFHYPLIKIYNPNKLEAYIQTFFKREGIT